MKKHIYLFVLLLGIFAGFSSEKITITGTIVDELGVPVPGVNVVEKGTDNGTVSDLDGNYTLRVSPGSKIVFTFIGYNKEVIRVDGNTNVLNIELTPDINSVDEIVIVC